MIGYQGRAVVGAVVAIAIAAMGSVHVRTLGAQQPTPPPSQRTQPPRRGETIEIRGQVPTPQVVTVRPREAPAYSRRVLVPAYFDHNFWPSILPPLQIISPASTSRSDTTGRAAADSAGAARPTPRPPSGTPPAPLRR